MSMNDIQKAMTSAIITCFKNTVNAIRSNSRLLPIEQTDEDWTRDFMQAALEPKFEEFLKTVAIQADNNQYSLGKAHKAWKIGWLMARTFKDNFVKTEEPKNENLCS
jgi:hypothetical protein